MKVFGWILISSVLAVPVLIGVGLYKWLRSHADLPAWRSAVGVMSSVLALVSWSLFIFGAFRGWIGGFRSHYVTHLGASNAGLGVSVLALLCAFFLNRTSRVLGLLSSMVMFFLWGGSQLVA
jgi:hypothetical protein